MKKRKPKSDLVKPEKLTREHSARGATGFILIGPLSTPVFRVYDKNKGFKDYDLAYADLEVKILSDDATFYSSPGKKRLDYSRQTLGLALKDISKRGKKK